MKCNECCGDGYNLRIIKKGNGYTTERVICEHCNGTGEVQTTETKLKPCPFCGKEPVYVADGKVICVCGAMMRSFNDWNPFTNQEAVNRWNERVVDANKTITCFKCHGAGVFGVPYLDDNEEWDGRLNVRRCEVCGGTGKITLALYEKWQKRMRGDKE